MRDPQGLAGAPETGKLMELMTWLASPDGGRLNLGQAVDIARAISRGDVPHVKIQRPLEALVINSTGIEYMKADVNDAIIMAGLLATAGGTVIMIREKQHD